LVRWAQAFLLGSALMSSVPSAAAPAWQAASAIAASNGGNVTVTLPAHVANDVMLLQVLVRDTNDTITWPTGWTQLATVDRGTTSRTWWAWKRAASASETNPLISKSTATGDTYAAVTTYRGASTIGDPWEAKGTPNTSTVAGHVLNGVTTLSDDALVVASLCGEDNSAGSGTNFTATSPSALAEVLYVESNTGSDGSCIAGAAAKATAGATGNVTATWTATVVGSAGIVLALKSAPAVRSMTKASTDPTSPGASVIWTVNFSTSVTGVNAADFSLVTTGSVSGAAITSVAGSGTTWTVTASTGTGNGTLGLNVVDDDTIAAASGEALGGAGAGNGNFTGPAYTVFSCTPPSNVPASVLTCVCDNFNRASLNPSTIFNSNFTATTSDSTGVLPSIVSSGFLRLTENTGNNAKAVTIPGIFPAAGNYISVEFRHYAYKTGGATGADGMSVTLSDYSVPAQPGAFGGSLGYAQKTGIVGFAGGWLGVALDEFGNFSNPTEGRVGGAGFFAQSVTARGSGSGTTGYNYLGHNVVGNVDNTSSATPSRGFLYQVIVDARSNLTGSGPTAVQVNRDTGAGYASLLSFANIFTTASGLGFTQAPVPANWQLSLTGSTGGSTNTHEIGSLKICAQTIYPPTGGTAANFNAIDESYGNSTLNALQGRLFTKLAGTAFALNVVALRDANSDGVADAIQTTYVVLGTKSVRVELVDDGVGTSCNASASACSACSKPVVASQTLSLAPTDGGFKKTANFTVAGAYSRLIARICEGTSCPGSGAIGCSTDAFAVRPTAFTQVLSSASNATGSGTPVFKAGTTAFTLIPRANATEYKGYPRLDPSAIEARDTALATGIVGTVDPTAVPAESANQFPSTTTYANVAAPTPTATDATASFTYSEAGSFRLLDKPAAAAAITDLTARGLYDDSWTIVDQGTAGDCVVASYSNVKNASGRYGCNFGITATTAWFGRFIPDRFDVDPATSAIVNRSDVPATATVGAFAAGATVLSVTAGSGSAFSVGEKVVVMGAGPGGAPLVTTVQAASASTLTLAAPLVTALAGAVSVYRPAASGFTYIGEPLLVVAGLKAVNGAGAVTQNYTGFTVTDWTDPAAANTLGLGLANAGGAAFTVDSVAGASGWRSGRASMAVPVTMTRGTTPTGPFAAAIGIAPRDADGVVLTTFDLDGDGNAVNERKSLGATALRYGRARVSNAFGSDKLPLPVPAETQYWNGNYWETNTLDLGGSTLSSPSITKTSGTGTVAHASGSVFSTGTATPGRFGLSLTTDGPAAVDLGYTVPGWLQYPWLGGTTMQNPSAKASFGVYPGSNRFIYRREVR
jgi:MSHA biogenesis protein MshQ